MLTILLGLLALILPVGFALGVYFLIHLHNEEILDRRATRYRNRTTYTYDPNGNPQFIYDATTGDLLIPPTGNTGFSPTILIRDSSQRNIKSDTERPMLININGGQKATRIAAQGEVISSEDVETEISVEPKLPVSEGETLLYIENCIEKGIGKLDAARAIGIRPGDNKPYKAFCSLWSTVVANKDKGALS
jgi:hypothetical protein